MSEVQPVRRTGYDHTMFNVYTHSCLDDLPGKEPAWWEKDAQGIELCKVCDLCREQKLSRYRPEVLSEYTQADVDEPIEPEE